MRHYFFDSSPLSHETLNIKALKKKQNDLLKYYKQKEKYLAIGT